MSGSSSSTTPPPLAVDEMFQTVRPSSSSRAFLMPSASRSYGSGSSTDSKRSGGWGGTSTISSMTVQVPEPGAGQAARRSSGDRDARGRLARLAQPLDGLGDRAARAADAEGVDEHDRGQHDAHRGEHAGHAEVEGGDLPGA